MAYGLQILTTDGFVSTDLVDSFQIIGSVYKTGTSGTVTPPSGWTASTGNIYPVARDNKTPPILIYDSGTNTFSYNNLADLAGLSSTSFDVYFIRI